VLVFTGLRHRHRRWAGCATRRREVRYLRRIRGDGNGTAVLGPFRVTRLPSWDLYEPMHGGWRHSRGFTLKWRTWLFVVSFRP
jgi:hypothetical protein